MTFWMAPIGFTLDAEVVLALHEVLEGLPLEVLLHHSAARLHRGRRMAALAALDSYVVQQGGHSHQPQGGEELLSHEGVEELHAGLLDPALNYI